MIVAYAGAPGAFAHEACLRFLPACDASPLKTFADVVDAICSGCADFGMLPISNNEAGDTGAKTLIDSAGLRIVEEHVLPVRMHLLGLPSATLEDIRTVSSHPLALRQCAKSLAELGAEATETSNTAVAARDLFRRDCAALASESAALFYERAILRRDMQDRDDNATTFAIVARGDE